MGTDKTRRGGVYSRKELYLTLQAHFPEALETLVEIMRNAKQDSVRVSAANKIMDKILPDLKSQTFEDEDGNIKPIPIYTIHVQRDNSNSEDSQIKIENQGS
ncbi:hypothetical protein KO465_09020 [Candidatus Micrarchaeota archaeon]|jgi:hypothetical protein|nr:hypothetical protein [Candidatus Micrarchaeota archaeon]